MKTALKLFGNSHLPHILDDNDKKRILDNLFVKSGICVPEKSISNCKLISNNNVNLLEKGYLAIAVPEELKIYIYFTKIGGEKKSFIILRKLTEGYRYPKIITLSPDVVLCDEIFEGTLIEATRAFVDSQRYVVLMTDIKILKGSTEIRKENYIQRLKTIGNFIMNDYKEILKKYPFRLQIITPYTHISLIEQRIKNLPYKVEKISFISHDNTHSNLYYSI
jgi:hypothetical protein